MSTPTMTAEAFAAWTNHAEADGRRHELAGGRPAELKAWPAAFDLARLRVAEVLSGYVLARGAGSVAFLDDGLITRRNPDTVRRPAVMVFTAPADTDGFPLRFTEEVPQLVVELFPPGDSYSRLIRRVMDYVQFGVQLVWVVEPDSRDLSIYRPKHHVEVLELDDELTGNGVLPDFSCRVADLFALPGQPPPTNPSPQP